MRRAGVAALALAGALLVAGCGDSGDSQKTAETLNPDTIAAPGAPTARPLPKLTIGNLDGIEQKSATVNGQQRIAIAFDDGSVGLATLTRSTESVALIVQRLRLSTQMPAEITKARRAKAPFGWRGTMMHIRFSSTSFRTLYLIGKDNVVISIAVDAKTQKRASEHAAAILAASAIDR